MSENELAGEIPVPEQAVTAAPEPEVSSPEVNAEPQQSEEQPAAKTFTQDELDLLESNASGNVSKLSVRQMPRLSKHPLNCRQQISLSPQKPMQKHWLNVRHKN
jgi:hypothetical protein